MEINQVKMMIKFYAQIWQEFPTKKEPSPLAGHQSGTRNGPEGEISPDPKISLLGKWQCKLPHWGLNLLACGCALLWEISWSWWTLWFELECCDASAQDCLCNGMWAVWQTSILYDLLWQNCDFTGRNEGAVQYLSCAYVSKSQDMANCDTMSLACYCVDMLIM